MRIYILRHGEALPKNDPSVSSDSERPLVEDGIRRTRQSAEGLKKMGVKLNAVFTSPWKRARETAAIAGDVLGVSNIVEMEELAGDRSVDDVMNGLAAQSPHPEIMLVGHQPLLGEVAAYLLSLSTGMRVDLKKSGVCALDVDRVPPKSPGTLLWLMTARQLRSMR